MGWGARGTGGPGHREGGREGGDGAEHALPGGGGRASGARCSGSAEPLWLPNHHHHRHLHSLARPDLAWCSAEASVVTLGQVSGCRGDPAPRCQGVLLLDLEGGHLRDLGVVGVAALEPLGGALPTPAPRSAAARPRRWQGPGGGGGGRVPLGCPGSCRGSEGREGQRPGGFLAWQLPPQQSSPTF